ncbi:hypothetical protein L6452_05555 [Arctium lappa]|uniref:Uncharacterized protein n=1 Tax=Arctium lappa TaxID=4217 RepID=A0ACB9EGF9_ARCLA|nr:hypothetical protein L6452_05555 [Arctium lappa]
MGGGLISCKRAHGLVLEEIVETWRSKPIQRSRSNLSLHISLPHFSSLSQTLPSSLSSLPNLHSFSRVFSDSLRWQMVKTFSHSSVIMEPEWLRLDLREMMLQGLCSQVSLADLVTPV